MYEYKTRVGFSNVGNDHRLKIYGLMNILQDTTCFHSDDIGYGLEWLAPQHMGWFVTNYEVHINEMPVYGQEVIVRTYAVSFKGMLGNRNFEVLDTEGKVLAYASSLWILMDLDKLMPVRVPAEMVEAYEVSEPPAHDYRGGKLRPNKDAAKVGTFKVEKMHLDTNDHMNNSIYIDVTSRFLPEGFEAKTVMINYKKAARLDDELEVRRSESEGGCQILLVKDEEVYTIVEFLND